VSASAMTSSPETQIQVLLRAPQPICETVAYQIARRYSGTRCGLMTESLSSVAPHQRDDPALHLDAIGGEDAGFMAFITRLQRDRVASAA
jgi:hypothetical protein